MTVNHHDLVRCTFLAAFIGPSSSLDSTSLRTEANGKVARVALYSPTLFVVVVNAEMAFEALDTEVDIVLFVLMLNLDVIGDTL